MNVRCLAADTPDAIDQAAQHLTAGGLLGLPTETVYGLGADADNAVAVARIFEVKGRPLGHPLIVHVAGLTGPQDPTQRDNNHRRAQWLAVLEDYAELAAMSAPAQTMLANLVMAFWPGPLTLIVPRQPGRAELAAGGQNSIGLRCPAHPVAQAVLQAAKRLGVSGIAAPSANRFGRISPTCAQHVLDDLGEPSEQSEQSGCEDLLVLDGGVSPVGIESSIVDLTSGLPVLLRPGMVQVADIERVCGQSLTAAGSQAPKVSGSLAEHYAPTKPLYLIAGDELMSALDGEQDGASHAERNDLHVGLSKGLSEGVRIAVYARMSPTNAVKLTLATSEKNGCAAEVGQTDGSESQDSKTATATATKDRQELGITWRAMPEQAVAAAQVLFSDLRALDRLAGVDEIWVQTPPDTPEWQGVRDRLERASVKTINSNTRQKKW